MNHPSFEAPTIETMNRLLPAFEFSSFIAHDEFAAVYFAKQRSLDRSVAIKVISPDISGKPEFRKSFEVTARTMAKLNHSNLIGVYDSGFVEQMLYFVMEFVPGKSLERSSSGQIVEPSQALLLIKGICAGLAHAHQNGIVHGNLDPACILLNAKAEPKTGNFGLPHSTGPDESSTFAAPEVLAEPASATPRSDIYSVGAILYGLLTGQAHSLDSAPPSSISICGTAIDAAWQKATHQDPAERFESVTAFLEALSKPPAKSATPRAIVVPPSKKLAVADKNTPAPPPSAKPKPLRTSSGANWKLIRNLFIIAGLLYAISIAWDWRKKKTAQRERENREAIEQYESDKKTAREEAIKKSLERAKNAANITPDIDIPDPIDETPRESLERLRTALVAGEREEIPTGSIASGENDYLLISEAMSWPDAASFAEQHGGHLAIPNIPADVTWLSKQITGNHELWLGAGRSGRRNWTLADGTQWKPKKQPKGTGQYLAVNKFGMLRAVRSTEQHPFLIQWHRDGKNPGTLEATLTATLESLSQSSPVYPPGTTAYGARHYFFASRALTWDEAHDLAKSSGGQLAAASEIGEITTLEQFTNDLIGPDGIWIGGLRQDDQWTWMTGETWKSANWANDSPADISEAALSILPGSGWHARERTEPASGFIIEWSDDQKSTGAVSTDPGKSTGGTSSLNTKAKTLILALEEKRAKDLSDNVRKLGWDLNVISSNLSHGAQAAWSPHITKLKNLVTDSRVPLSIPESSGIKLTEQMAKSASSCARKQTEIDAKFLAEAEKVRSAYVTKISELQAKAAQSGQRALAQSLTTTLEKASNLADWTLSFGVEAQPESPLAETTATAKKEEKGEKV